MQQLRPEMMFNQIRLSDQNLKQLPSRFEIVLYPLKSNNFDEDTQNANRQLPLNTIVSFILSIPSPSLQNIVVSFHLSRSQQGEFESNKTEKRV